MSLDSLSSVLSANFINLAETVDDAVFVLSLHGALIYLNPAASRRFSLHATRHMHRPFLTVCAEENIDIPASLGLESMLNMAIPEPTPDPAPTHIKTKHHWSLTPLLGSDHETAALMLTAKDNTFALAHQRSTEAMALESIISNLPGYVAWTDRQGRILGCNTAFAKSAGFECPSEVIGKTNHDLPWRNVADQIRMKDLEVIENAEAITTEGFIYDRASNKIPLLSKRVPLFDKDGHVYGVAGIAFDITERKLAEIEMAKAKDLSEAAYAAKNNFIANMSHDLRTPLHGLLGLSEVLLLQKHYPDQVECIESIQAAGKSILDILEDILNFSKMDCEQINIKPRFFSLRQMAEEIIAGFTDDMQAKKLSIEFWYDDSVPSIIRSDPDLVRKIITNLVSNAVKFTENGGLSLQVNCLNTSTTTNHDTMVGYIKIDITDTGIGLSDDNLPFIFDRFYRVDPSYRGKYKGTGLGLSIAKQCADAIDANIAVTSTMGEGSTFTVTFPFETDAKMRSANEPVLVDQHFTHTVLLVEDEPLAQKASVSILTKLGCSVDTASNAKEAIALYQSGEYDLIFMDIGLPDIDGLTLTEELKGLQINQDARIYALTSHATEEDHATCQSVGMDGFLLKPAQYRQFKEVLKNVPCKKAI